MSELARREWNISENKVAVLYHPLYLVAVCRVSTFNANGKEAYEVCLNYMYIRSVYVLLPVK